MPLLPIVKYRLDFLAFAVLALAGLWLCRHILRERGAGMRFPRTVEIITLVLVILGGLLADISARRQKNFLISIFAGFGPSYADGISRLGHARITVNTPPDDPTYLALIAAERNWLRLNPLIADIYTVRLGEDGKVRFIVDSETDYDGNGRIDGEREQRTAIGEVFPDVTPAFLEAFAGRPAFDTTLVPDRWGVWVTSLTPIFDESGKVEAVVGIDYPGAAWLSSIAARRALMLTTILFVIGLMQSAAALLSLMRGEIANRASAQAALQEAKAEAERANRAKGEYLAVMSHEIRTPLNAITGYASMLEDSPLDAIQQRYVQTVRRGATCLVDLLNNILDYSRIEEGKLDLEEAPCAPAEIAREVVDLLAANAHEKNVSLVFRDELGGPLVILADHARLRQVAMNLVGNAVKFTATGSVVVTATWTQGSSVPPSGILTLTVTDTGPGIAPDILPHLFQMFAQGSTSVARRHGGSGLGLAISRRLVEMMHGKINVQSQLGVGSEFTVTIPARSVPPPADAEPAPPAPAPSIGDPKELHFLVVDDDRVNREVLRAMLASGGHTCDLASSGTEAVSLAGRNHYDAILMDIAMPDMDGLAATQQIRANHPERHTPIVAVTAGTGKYDRERCEAAGMDDFIPKPISRPVLLSKLADLCAPKTPPPGSA
ncbi:ATP-binding protein [Opitutus sp. ER46]|uniref:hybrid sensor histidine kinase/response regulator n=1 Tax=Opitutus sp. ER46 TaxID=2161864 RepID=UPI000D3141F8|nr:ATP-binding protein [Opitutus sp. ER46]PTX91136.1 hypothetical protein DB354_21110 [Opitutus sp. ER46]